MTAQPLPILPGSWLGLLGGGQLGRMFCIAAQSLGYRVAVLDPGEHGPAASVADRHIRADYLDPSGLLQLASLAKAATFRAVASVSTPAGSRTMAASGTPCATR